MNRVSIAGTDAGFDCAPSETLLRAGLRAGFGMPYACSIGTCGECKIDILAGMFAPHSGPQLPGLSERDIGRGRLLACQAKPTSDCTIKLHLEDRYRSKFPPDIHSAKLLSVEAVAPQMMMCRFQSAQPALFQAGQYARILVSVSGTWRAFSMCNLANEDGLWNFLIRPIAGGATSQALFAHDAVGKSFSIDGPYGNAWHRSGVRSIICVAGGAGLAPVLSVARAAMSDADCTSVRLLYGGRTADDLCAKNLLQPSSRSDMQVEVHEVVSDDSEGWSGPRGMIHDYLDQIIPAIAENVDCYVAGPPPMVDAVIDVLQSAKKVSPQHIYFDRFFG